MAQAVYHQFSSVMYDAARLSYRQNAKTTRDVVRWAHDQDPCLEAELGQAEGKMSEPPLDARAPGGGRRHH
ncbi:class II fructose-bisphosphate aldolase [Streptomyces sp. NPDC020800]|uniref:class II fructose-bisphosphate aldolase n=1 Tax=Streptomyces sp. NPDC020800 TaxID=3365092 RepID=UPI0037A487FB